MLVDANILLYAADELSPYHDDASEWLTARLNGTQRVALPWQVLVAFVRISTHPRIYQRPLEASQATDLVRSWVTSPAGWIPHPGPRHMDVFTDLVRRYHLRGNLISDAHLAALAIEHGLQICSADTDFARFADVRWHNPVSPQAGEPGNDA